MIRVRQVRISIYKDNLKEKIAKKLKTSINNIIDYKIIKESIDSRDKNNILFVYELDVNLKDDSNIKYNNDIFLSPKEIYEYTPTGNEKLNERPVIVGSGPAGLFCAYELAINGYKPIIIERGKQIEERVKDVELFLTTNKLNSESNVQFGEGGAGTFSDGKLNTMIKDKRFIGKKVFEVFIECGAPKEILYKNKPHIGTDLLRKIIINLRNKIISLGGEFKYNTKLTDLVIDNKKITGIIVNNKERINTDVLILAIGHSARDTFYMLKSYLTMESKPFAIGVRIEHLQKDIDKSLYGKSIDILGPASYKLTYKTNSGRGVYSFCMCPGGYVINSSSEENRLVINGMSNNKRDSKNANSAIVVTVDSNDFGEGLFAGMEFQKVLEEKAYILGEGKIPVSLYKDFKENKESKHFGNVKPEIMGEFTFKNLNEILPMYIKDSLIEGIEYFNKIIDGFNRDDAIISGLETRTSSPIRIIRNDVLESNIEGIYPCGEGAGYAGGITSSAIDGIKVSESIMNKYSA